MSETPNQVLNTESKKESVPKKFNLSTLSFVILTSATALLPIFFIPTISFPYMFGKVWLAVISVLLAFIFIGIHILKEGKFFYPKVYLLMSAVLIPSTAFISAIFSPAIRVSLVGSGFQNDTFAFLAIGVLALLMFSVTFTTKKRIITILIALFTSLALLMIFQIVRVFFGAQVLNFGLFKSVTSSVFGKWNELAIVSGLIALFSLITIESTQGIKLLKIISHIFLASALFMMAVINFKTVWYVLCIFAGLYFIYRFSTIQFSPVSKVSKKDTIADYTSIPTKKNTWIYEMPITTFVVVIISLVFLFFGNTINIWLSNQFSISNLEVRPNWSSTLTIAKDVLKQDPLLGIGPSRFANAWQMHKPSIINTSNFWNVDFRSGVGLIPTFVITTGLLGLVSWIIFFALFLWIFLRALVSYRSDKVMKYIIIALLLSTTYLWVFSILYTVGAMLFMFAFIFTGLLIAVLSHEKIVKTAQLNFVDNPKMSFTVSLAIIIAIFTCLGVAFIYSKKLIGDMQYQQALVALQIDNDIDRAEMLLNSAIKSHNNDLYQRSLSDLSIIRLNALMSSGLVTKAGIEKDFQKYFGDAIAHARDATDYDGTNYLNWTQFGKIYVLVLPLKIDGVYKNAKDAYEKALVYNPNNPEIYLALARIEFAERNVVKAREFLAESLQKKNNYTEAIFLLSQIEASEGNLAGAVSSAREASFLAPNDAIVFFQLGILLYNQKDYLDTITALERAVTLQPEYANARYFLGLSYAQVGRRDNAIKEFEAIEKDNVDNTEVKTILSNLRAGRKPFEGVVQPQNEAPEKRESLPIDETMENDNLQVSEIEAVKIQTGEAQSEELVDEERDF